MWFLSWYTSSRHYYIFITSQRKHRRTQTYKTCKIIHNKTTIKLQICSQRCRKRVCYCNFYTVSGCSRPDTILTAQKHVMDCASHSLFRQIVFDDSHVLHYLLPAKHDSLIADRLRSATSFPILHTRTTFYRLHQSIFSRLISTLLCLYSCMNV